MSLQQSDKPMKKKTLYLRKKKKKTSSVSKCVLSLSPKIC